MSPVMSPTTVGRGLPGSEQGRSNNDIRLHSARANGYDPGQPPEPCPRARSGSPSAYDARLGRARRGRLSLLPALALLLGAPCLFNAAPAQAQIPIWQATLTVAQDTATGEFGCTSQQGSLCSSGLTSDTFLIGDTFTGDIVEYTIVFLRLDAAGRLNFRVDKPIPASDRAELMLHLGSTELPLAHGTPFASHSGLTWSGTGLSWSVGETVSLRLSVPPPEPRVPPTVSLSVGPSRSVTEGSDFYVTATLSDPWEDTVRIPLTLTNQTAEPDDYRYKHVHTGYITIVAFQTQATQWFQTNHDDDDQDETFTVSIDTAGLPSAVTAGSPSSLSIRIDDDEDTGETVTSAAETRIVGRRSRATGTPYCFVPGSAELASLGESTHLKYRLDSAQDFDLCLWAPDPNWKNAPAYATCRGTGGVLPGYASLVEGPGREAFSAARTPGRMACVVPPGPAGQSGDWTLRIAADNPEPEESE